MTALNIKIIRDSFELARPHAIGIVARFYEILWKDYPSIQPLFSKTDMEQQKNALVGSLAYIVSHLDEGENLEKYLKSMGARHVRYGVEDEHYVMVGNSLIKTFAEAFGESWTRDLAEQWGLAVSVIAQMMKEGARATVEARGNSKKSNTAQSTMGESMNSPRTPPHENVRIELPADVRQEIRQQVRDALQEAIQNEIQQCIQEELKILKQSNVYELIRKRA